MSIDIDYAACPDMHYEEEDEEPAELNFEDIQASYFEFDAMFEFDADQWFDFTDIDALYNYTSKKPELGDGEWADAAEWFAAVHDGHEADYSTYSFYATDDGIADIDRAFSRDDVLAVESAWKTPTKKATRISPAGRSPTAVNSSPTSLSPQQTPTSARKLHYMALSPLSTKTDSPLKSGALRVRIEHGTAASEAKLHPSKSEDSITAKVHSTGAQRQLVLTKTTQASTSIAPSRPDVAQRSQLPPSKSTSNHSRTTSLNSANTKPIKRTTGSPNKERTSPHVLLPHNLDSTRPTHEIQIPPKAYLKNLQKTAGAARVAPAKTTMVTKRAVGAKLAPSRPVAPVSQAKPTAHNAKISSPTREPSSTCATRVMSSQMPSAEKRLLQQVDNILAQQQSLRQKVTPEAR